MKPKGIATIAMLTLATLVNVTQKTYPICLTSPKVAKASMANVAIAYVLQETLVTVHMP